MAEKFYPHKLTVRDVIFDVPTQCHYGRQITGFISFQGLLNFNIQHYLAVLDLVIAELQLCSAKADESQDIYLDDAEKSRIGSKIKLASETAKALGLTTVLNRAERIQAKLRPHTFVLAADMRAELTVLIQSFEDDTKYAYFYAYPKDKAIYVLSYQSQWQPAVNAFPSSVKDIGAAADCYALGYNTACVFHCMRVLETGLGVFANEFGLAFDVQQWHTIIEGIEAKIREKGNGLSRGAAKAEIMQFYSEAAKEFFYFKDGWRNYVSHSRGDYDEYQAQGILEHVRAFMNHLSTRLSEEPLSEAQPA